MTKNNANKPAFGGYEYADSGHALLDPVKVRVNGLTKREYFAGLAMQGLCTTYSEDLLVKRAVIVADALLAELEKTKPSNDGN